MKASQNNDLTHEVGLPLEEVSKRYTSWAREYDKDLSEENFRGPCIIADRMCELFPDVNSRAHLRIIDVAAGTGLVGIKLKPLSFEIIDALEPSEGMMEMLKEKNVYNDTLLGFINEHALPIETATYDVAVISGGMGEGHIPCQGLDELVRIVKSGGYVLIVMREAYLENVSEYKDRLEPYMSKLETTGLWKMTARQVIPMYSWSNNGVLYTFRIK